MIFEFFSQLFVRNPVALGSSSANRPFLAGSPKAEITLPSAKSPELMETLSLKRLPTAPVPQCRYQNHKTSQSRRV